jgi:bacteriocin biosynthesis cyclodehydratase domain-containing protein
MRAAPDVDTRRLRDGAASFLIQVGQDAPAELFAHGLGRRRLPHLLIEERDDAILVGPLVLPGRSACIRCLDLHRRDRDPAWPAIAAQLATAPGRISTAATSTALIATGVAAGEVLGFIDGLETEALEASIEVRPLARIRRRSWHPHPSCACIDTKRRSIGDER